MGIRRSGLWVEIGLALGLISLTAILLSAGVAWLVFSQVDADRRTDLALATARSLRAQLEAEWRREDPQWNRVLAPYKEPGNEVTALWVVDRTLSAVSESIGEAPSSPDAGLREAVFGKQEHVELEGSRLSVQTVVVTEPLMQGRAIQGALRLSMELRPGSMLGGRLPFLLVYTVLCGVVVAGFGSALFRRTLVRPIKELQKATHRIAGGEFGHTAQVDAAEELVELAGALNTMSLSLEQYRERTATQLEHLERANRELRQVQEELVRSEKLASVGRLAAGIAHEVGNPLAAVLGYTELLAGGLDDPELERDLLDRSGKELERIQVIIRELLAFARPGTGEKTEVDLAGLVEEALRMARMHPATRDVDFEIQVDAPLPVVSAEPDKIHQVLLNLLVNAGQALEGKGEVVLSLEIGEEEVVVACTDDGPGFDPVDLHRVFDPFFSTKEPGSGTGLGLATSLRILEEQGGWMKAENAQSGGARVSFGLPRVEQG